MGNEEEVVNSVQDESKDNKSKAVGKTSASSLISAEAGRKYWKDISANDDGMLGGIPAFQGFSSVSRVDIQGSRTFLARLGIGLKSGRKSVASALDGGAGIGRVTEGVLLRVAEYVDVVEPISKFTERLKSKPGVRNIFNVGLEEWQPPPGTEYDLIWTQWCLGHLTDEQLVKYLALCKTLLTESGVIVIKENLTTSGTDLFDETDSSITRQDESFRRCFEAAGLRLVKTELQRGLPEKPPKRLFPVRMYALKP